MIEHKVHPDGSQEWRQDGKLHREDGPALIWSDGSKEWWIKGKLHREDGPAIIWKYGTKFLYQNGRFIKKYDPNKITINWSNEGF